MTQEYKIAISLIKLQDEYINVLVAEIVGLINHVNVNRWKSSLVDVGKQLRDDIQALKEQLPEPEIV